MSIPLKIEPDRASFRVRPVYQLMLKLRVVTPHVEMEVQRGEAAKGPGIHQDQRGRDC
jgi:hypothetical protein